MIVVPYSPEHLERLEPRDCYASGECPKTIMNSAFTFLDRGEVVAICGGFPFVPGVIHFWGLLSEKITRTPIAFHKRCLDVLEWYEKQEKPRRIQIDVRADYVMGKRWAESLGFTLEGTMPAWAPDGAAHHLYGRLNRWL